MRLQQHQQRYKAMHTPTTALLTLGVALLVALLLYGRLLWWLLFSS